jgi:hypothetical protein
MAKQKQVRLTDHLNVLLSTAASHLAIGRTNPGTDAKAHACAEAMKAVDEAMEVLAAIRRAAETI